MMISNLTLTTLLLVATAVAIRPSRSKAKAPTDISKNFRKYKEECITEMDFNRDDVTAYFDAFTAAQQNKQAIPAPSRDIGCLLSCILTKNGQIKTDGKIQVCEIGSLLEGSEWLQQCFDDLTETDECLMAVKGTRCVYDFAETKFGKSVQGLDIKQMIDRFA